MSNQFNPHASPSAIDPAIVPMSQRRLADLGKRFLGALIDGLAGVVVLPGYLLIVMGAPEEPEQGFGASAVLGTIWLLVVGLALLAVQIYLLYTRSQSIGKCVMKTQIVDFNTGTRASFVNCFLLRAVVNGVIGGIPCVGAVYSLVVILFIFRPDHRCLHDLLAKTQVVDIA